MDADLLSRITQGGLFEQAKSGEVLRAYVLIRCDLGFATSVAESVSSVAGVHCTAELIGSPYDVIALVHVKDFDELAKAVLPEIDGNEYVKDSTTAVAVGTHFTGGSRKVHNGWP